MKNKRQELKEVFNLFNELLNKNNGEDITDEINGILDNLVIFIETNNDPLLAADFQSCWLEIKEKIKNKLEDENHFIIQDRRIRISIERAMFPELS